MVLATLSYLVCQLRRQFIVFNKHDTFIISVLSDCNKGILSLMISPSRYVNKINMIVFCKVIRLLFASV